MQPNTHRLVQLGVSGLIFILAWIVIGTTGHTLNVFQSEQGSNQRWLPLWANHFEDNGTRGLLGAGIVAVLASAFHLLMVLTPRFNLISHPTLTALTVLIAATPGAFISLSVVTFAHLLNKSDKIATIESWTCKFKDDDSLPDGVSNGDFTRLCAESKTAIWTTFIICLLQASLIILALVGWFVTKRTQRRQAKMQKQDQQWDPAFAQPPGDVEMHGFEKPYPAVHIAEGH